MKNLNQLTVQGNLVQTPEVLENEHGKITYFDVACSNSFTPKDKEKVTHTTYVKCQAKGKQADYIAKYFKSGNRVIINGELRNSSFTVENKKYTTLVVQVTEIFQNSNNKSSDNK